MWHPQGPWTNLYFTYALTRYRYGRLLNCEPSRFLEEVDPNCIKVNKRMTTALAGALRNESSEGRAGFVGLKKPVMRGNTPPKYTHRVLTLNLPIPIIWQEA
jgi:DNA helicase II / ATP-dependent DNA helicase PcrA